MRQNLHNMEANTIVIFISAIIPIIVGSAWYSPKVFGGVWMRAAEISKERAASGNMFLILALTYFLGLLLAFSMALMTIHQIGLFQVLSEQAGFGEAGTVTTVYFEDFMARYGNFHRDWKHGMLHGGFAAVITVLPIIAINALFERRGWKYIAVHFGYWFVTFILMGGFVCHFL